MKIKSHILGVVLLSGMVLTGCNAQTQGSSNENENSTTQEQTRGTYRDVDVNTFADLKQGEGILLDVRTPEEYSQGHLEGAMHIDFYGQDFQNEISKLDKDTPVYVYCRSGGRSGKTMDMMKQMGFKEVYNLDGGITAWQGSGKPVVTE
ncbi:MAG: rhodanese-like domain-containing protein [Bacteroidota bacterium]|nr:rhodanese-like domain-containing protein [Bacteroidota bacterium]MDX5404479.1 rhodanese-like domain-containing protein [Bacteroidota bacterium]MDX5428449.1 rhodanese-like domain-containing protein [Bacteroidota bacterium]MDX5446877.1 rhodanese-like domain-containing protein [Bacteroidota bacterium]MDX5506213.1 rhodanese-like domain-containing protein [Bacteroidota bacterium]